MSVPTQDNEVKKRMGILRGRGESICLSERINNGSELQGIDQLKEKRYMGQRKLLSVMKTH
ncbi:hypothetical protein LguiA_020533 [Lonicera macranthoides]